MQSPAPPQVSPFEQSELAVHWTFLPPQVDETTARSHRTTIDAMRARLPRVERWLREESMMVPSRCIRLGEKDHAIDAAEHRGAPATVAESRTGSWPGSLLTPGLRDGRAPLRRRPVRRLERHLHRRGRDLHDVELARHRLDDDPRIGPTRLPLCDSLCPDLTRSPCHTLDRYASRLRASRMRFVGRIRLFSK
jgi:hypothetical protein